MAQGVLTKNLGNRRNLRIVFELSKGRFDVLIAVRLI